MFRRLRNSLRRIRYYSARRQHTRWTAAMDYSVFIALVLALPATWLSTMMISRGQLAEQWPGRLWRDDQGTVVATLIPPGTSEQWVVPRPYGSFTFQLFQQRRGVPLACVVRTEPLVLELDLFHEPDARTASFDSSSPAVVAIERDMRAAGRDDLIEAVNARQRQVEHLPVSWVVNTVFWWFGLYIAMVVCLALASLASSVVRGIGLTRAARRRSSGLCVSCGYDMRGLEFAARCPECGALVS